MMIFLCYSQETHEHAELLEVFDSEKKALDWIGSIGKFRYDPENNVVAEGSSDLYSAFRRAYGLLSLLGRKTTGELMVTMDAIAKYNAECGFFFFSEATMRFWKTRLMPSSVCDGPGGVFFVTSDVFRGRRLYSVRRFYKVGYVESFNCCFPDACSAKRKAKELSNVRS